MSKISAIIGFKQNKISSGANQDVTSNANSPYYFDPTRVSKDELKESKLLPNNLKTKWEIAKHKCLNTLSVYPAKGFAGDKNSNFYEFLTMGMFPYVMGSLTFMALFNGVTKYFAPRCADAAKKYGFGMALGVIFYGLAKSLSRKLISTPVAIKTGIDMDRPYRKVVDLIPNPSQNDSTQNKKEKLLSGMNKEDNTAFEYHTAFESVDFPRTDLFYNRAKGKKRNEYYDMIAQKNGFGTNLNDSDQEVKPFIKEVVTKARTAQNISQYLWAATGVALGVQEPWSRLINIKPRKYTGLSIWGYAKDITKTTGKAFIDSCKSLFNGGTDGVINKKSRYVGRTIIALAAATTIFGILNAIRNPYMKNNKNMSDSKIFNDSSKVKED